MVIANLNLASRPFRNRTLPWAVTAIVVSISLVWLAFTISEYREARRQTAALEPHLRALQQQRARLEAQAAEVRRGLPEDQLQTLQAAHLLVDRKRFSWSRLFVDLEAALPESVRVTRINVRDVATRASQTLAELDLTVIARTPDDVIKMINEMDRVGVFIAEPRTEQPRTGKGESGVEWTLRVRYTPRASVSTASEDTPVASH